MTVISCLEIDKIIKCMFIQYKFCICHCSCLLIYLWTLMITCLHLNKSFKNSFIHVISSLPICSFLLFLLFWLINLHLFISLHSRTTDTLHFTFIALFINFGSSNGLLAWFIHYAYFFYLEQWSVQNKNSSNSYCGWLLLLDTYHLENL